MRHGRADGACAEQLAQTPAGGGTTRGDPPYCPSLATIAVETDRGSLAHFGGSVPAATAYAGTLIGAVSENATRATSEAHMQIGFLPQSGRRPIRWTTNDALDQIFQFPGCWNLNMTHISRHAARIT